MVSYVEKDVQSKLTTSEAEVDNKVMNLAASWYIAMQSKELGKKPQAIELFGRSLVAWRDKAGKAVIMERFCSHLGASLAIGEVVDGCIRCPFHHWRYDSSGVCVDIPKVATPTTDLIPPTARQYTYVTQEKYDYIWVWYGTATPLFDLPKFDAAENDKHKYMLYRFSFPVKTTVRRAIENAFDHHHLITMHNLPVVDQIRLTMLNEEDVEHSELPFAKEAWMGSFIEARIKSFIGVGAITKVLGLNIETLYNRIDVWPSGFISTMKFNGQQNEKLKAFTSFTPISENHIIWHILLTINKTGNLWLDLLSYIVFGWQVEVGGLEDKPVLDAMSAFTGRAFIKSDQPLLKFRQFYQTWVAKVQSN
ncbi:MAG: aromatic ring-hydroxylating dioxygenase subunit alpha [Pelatocladus maniniholoensis HA4357-MV3]|jgi:phenylpropionate dioxygenase-like ring-hydroxylating dioxygenase large terminal subunit|uniref:Aromatic ring-hydroxylating dioxygenase subunit alpha n=1 Tax=Pelatocladus maniniholoensis HA4357-MV3 TaxID=1117104 RepID=A0A9E3LUS2_9NOST|nr:aromatic ring-hydroxylating dioxygenase subunit alpha [Pelatocladus maniniholoensis HA4357-MV3]BAZ70689.1 Rieske [2Fe-2S] domain-containing protein [Fischerella sp. NIES-4106]